MSRRTPTPDDEDACRKCGAPTNNGEGWDGLCGNCADKAEGEGGVVSRDAIENWLKEQAGNPWHWTTFKRAERIARVAISAADYMDEFSRTEYEARLWEAISEPVRG